MDRWPGLAPSKRPKAFNRLMRAMVRTMSELGNNLAVAYAMDQTKRYFEERELEEQPTRATEQWREAKFDFERMAFEQQIEWHKHVEKHFPRLDKLVEGATSQS